jgi:hypothetical protein
VTLDPALLASLGALIGVIGGLMKIFKDLREAARLSEGRFKDLEIKTGFLWDLFREDAKVALRRAGAVVSQSPDRLSPQAARHLVQNGFGARLLAFYAELIAKTPDVTEADGTWQLYVAFKPDLGPNLMEPFAMNLSEALVAAWQFCVDGGIEHD